ncbi:MAG: nucleotidyltransferase family protein [Chloroflexi bacterium]|nr:nucleotidyltransferase family protein [Chloroflexota bacterium]
MGHIQVPAEAVRAFCQRNRIRRLSLFGSVLREDFGPESDIDVLVEFAPEAEVGFLALSRMQRELSALFGRQVDLVPRAGLKPAIREHILQSEELLYAS